MKTKSISFIITFLLIIGGLFAYKYYEIYQADVAAANKTPEPIAVTALPAKVEDWQPYLDAIGTLSAENGIQVTTQVPGVISKINFSSGDNIQVGDTLLWLDTDVLQAQLVNAKAAEKLAQVNFKRYTKLKQTNTVADVDYDQMRSTYQQAAATVAQIEAEIAQMKVLAPFSGKLGIKQVSLGQYLAPGDVITSLQALENLYVDFQIPATKFDDLKIGQAIEVNVGSDANKIYPGTIQALNSIADGNTRNIEVRGIISNKAGTLLPGMYATVKVLLPKETNQVVVPNTAISYTLYGTTVFVAQPEEKEGKISYVAKLKTVSVGDHQGENVLITSGLKGNELVITSGQLKLIGGTPVTIKSKTNL